MGMMAVWLQWINTMVWYPTMLVFIAGTASHLFQPSFAHNKLFLLSLSLVIFWSLTLLNLRGIKVSLLINSICGVVGTLLPLLFLIVLGAWWLLTSDSLAITFSWKDIIPSFTLIDSSSALVTIMASFLGMELAGVYISDIENPQKNFPKAIGFAVLILLGTLIFGSLSVAMVIPKHDIHFVDGVMQTFTTFLNTFNMPYLIPALCLLIVIGGIGGSINWLLSPAKGLLQAAEFRFLPPFFLVKNKQGVPSRILISQACLVSIFCRFLHFVPNVNTYYWFLMSLSTGLYMVVYILLFVAALKLRRPDTGYQIPRNIRFMSCFAGICACLMTIVIGFQPPSEMPIENRINYVFMIIVGFGLMTAPVAFFWRYQKKQERLNLPGQNLLIH
jgi:amino acid transporter